MNYVLMAGDAQVLTQLRVCVASLALVATDKSNYTVVVAYDGDLTAARWALIGLGVTVHVRALGDVPKCDNVVNNEFFLINHPATLARLQPMRYLPMGIDRALYVDADSLFIADPAPLFSMPLGKWYVCAGVESVSVKSCAGLLFYNLVAWRQHDIEKTLAKRIACITEPNDEVVLREIVWRHARFTPMLYNVSNGKLSSFAVVVHFWQTEPWDRKWSAFAMAWFAFAYNLPRWVCWLCIWFGRMYLLNF